MPKASIVSVGDKFNQWTVVEELPRTPRKSSGFQRCFLVQCSCGSEPRSVQLGNLMSGKSASCGCWKTTHGMSKAKPYKVWSSMIARCTNPKYPQWMDYGGRGVGVSEEWKSFELFWQDMKEGYQEQLTLERVNVNKGYSKENCVWANRNIQQHNQRKKSKTKYIYKGINYHSKNPSVEIRYQGVVYYLGTFSSEILAATAYDEASEIIYGDRPNSTEKDEDIYQKVKFIIERRNK